MYTRRFNKAFQGQVLTRDERVRQGRAVNAAIAALGSGGAPAFLNAHHDGMSGRPIDLAIASDHGLAAVEAALGAVARRAPKAA